MPWVRSHRRRNGLFGRSTRVRSHYRRSPGVPIVPIVIAVIVILVLIALF